MTRMIAIAAALALARVVAAEEGAKKAEKPVITCDQIVETYRASKSVDDTSSRLHIDQSQVAGCLKAKGIEMPMEDNR